MRLTRRAAVLAVCLVSLAACQSGESDRKPTAATPSQTQQSGSTTVAVERPSLEVILAAVIAREEAAGNSWSQEEYVCFAEVYRDSPLSDSAVNYVVDPDGDWAITDEDRAWLENQWSDVVEATCLVSGLASGLVLEQPSTGQGPIDLALPLVLGNDEYLTLDVEWAGAPGSTFAVSALDGEGNEVAHVVQAAGPYQGTVLITNEGPMASPEIESLRITPSENVTQWSVTPHWGGPDVTPLTRGMQGQGDQVLWVNGLSGDYSMTFHSDDPSGGLIQVWDFRTGGVLERNQQFMGQGDSPYDLQQAFTLPPESFFLVIRANGSWSID